MAKISDKQIAIDKAKLFLINTEKEIQFINTLPSGTHDYIYKILRTVAEINELEILATPTYKELFKLVYSYINNHPVQINPKDDKIAKNKEIYAQEYFINFLKKQADKEPPTKVEPLLKYWETE